MEDRDEKGRFIEGNKSKGARPKGSFSIKDTMRQFLDMKIKDIDPALVNVIVGKDKGFAKKYGNKTLRVGLAIAYTRKGLQGDWEFLAHLEGKPAFNLNVGGQEDNQLIIKLEGVDIGKFPKPNGS